MIFNSTVLIKTEKKLFSEWELFSSSLHHFAAKLKNTDSRSVLVHQNILFKFNRTWTQAPIHHPTSHVPNNNWSKSLSKKISDSSYRFKMLRVLDLTVIHTKSHSSRTKHSFMTSWINPFQISLTLTDRTLNNGRYNQVSFG